MKYHVLINGTHHEVEIQVEGAGLSARIGDEQHHLDLATLVDGMAYSLIVDGRSVDVGVEEQGDAVDLLIGGARYSTEVLGEREYMARSIQAQDLEGETSVRAVMAGVVQEVLVQPGDAVQPGQLLFILEAMKMENEVKAESGGTVAQVLVSAGDTVEQGDLVIEIEPPDDVN